MTVQSAEIVTFWQVRKLYTSDAAFATYLKTVNYENFVFEFRPAFSL